MGSLPRRSYPPQRISGGLLLRLLALSALAAVTFVLGSLAPVDLPPRSDSSQAALTILGQEYDDLQLWASAISATTDTLPAEGSERARALADQLARILGPLESEFERTTASLSTAQLELVLPLWERMAFAHAGFAMLQEEAATLGGDPTLQPAELHHLADELSAVVDFAAEIQRQIMTELTAPVATPIRVT
jgi:hypothetical protein